MAAKTFYWKDAVPTGATLHRSLQDGGSAPTDATTGTGWTVNQKATGQSCIQNGGSEVSRTDGQWGATLQPSGAPSQTIGDCWRSENTLTGTFANTDWTFALGVRSATAAYAGRLKLAVRVFRSTNANGSSATELTGARVASAATTANLSTTADTAISITWSPGAQHTLSGEYLFVALGVEVTSAGNANTQDCLIRVGSSYTITTPDFAVTSTGTASESASAADSQTAGGAFGAAASEGATAGDAADATQASARGITESATAGDSPAAAWAGAGSVAESAAAADATDRAAGIPADVSEGASASDSAAGELPGARIRIAWATFRTPKGIAGQAIAEPANATDAVSATATLNAAASEPATATDGPAAAWTGAGAVSEPASASDAAAAAWNGAATIAEASAAADALAAGGAFGAPITESANAADAPYALTSGAQIMDEPATAADSQTAGGIFGAPITETAAAADTPAAGGAFGAAITEPATASDDATAQTSSVQTVSEAASASDEQAQAWRGAGLLSESAPAAEAQAGERVALGTIAESVSANHAQTVARVVPADVSEAATAIDSVSCVVVFHGSIAEGTADAADTLAAAGLWNAAIAEPATAADAWIGSKEIAGVFEATPRAVARAGSRVARLGALLAARIGGRTGPPILDGEASRVGATIADGEPGRLGATPADVAPLRVGESVAQQPGAKLD